MAARQQYRSLPNTPELSHYDSEDSYSSDEEMPDREETNQLLRQAHHYVIIEGGEDSPSTYMERIQRINEDLVQEISAHGYDCDPKLFRRVKQKIDHVLREFEDAVDAGSSLYDYSDSPEYYAAADEEGLYRMDSSPTSPEAPSARRTARIGGKDDVERVYLYGGPGNHPESWYKKAVASLPFPETIRMAEWESLRIHWDLAATGNMEKTEPVTGNGVSFKDKRLAHHDSLPRYESGSRFTLPTPDSAVMKEVRGFGSVYQLQKAVKTFREGDDSKLSGEKGDDEDYKYAPCVFLERFDVGQQISPAAEGTSILKLSAETYADNATVIDEVRSAVNTTPTKPRSISNGSSKIVTTSPAIRAIVKNTQCPSMSTQADCPTPMDDDLPVTVVSPVQEAPRAQATAKTSTMRRIKAKTEDSLRSPNNLSSPPANWETKEATHVSIPKKTRGRPRKDVTPPAAATTTYQLTAAGKRKRLSTEPVEEQTAEDIQYEADLSRRRQLTRDAARPSTPTLPVSPDNLDTSASLPALTPGSSVMSTPPVVKARAAGRKQRKFTQRDFEQRVSPEEYKVIMAGRGQSVTAAAESIARGAQGVGSCVDCRL